MADRLEILPLRTDQDGAYIDFLEVLGKDYPSVLGYHYPFYRDLIQKASNAEPWYLGAWLEGELVAVLPGFLKQGSFGAVYCSLPFFGPNAGVLCNRLLFGVDQQKSIINQAVEFLRARPVALSATFYTPFLWEDYTAFHQALPGAHIVNKSTQYLNIPAFKPNKDLRYDLRKAENAGVQVERIRSAERLDEFYEIYLQNCREAGIPIKPLEAVRDLFSTAEVNEQVRIYYGLLGERLISGLIVIASPQTISYYLPCSLPEYRPLQPGTLLIHHALQEAREKGQVFWNWESSPVKDSGVYTFKKKWGSSEAGYRIYNQPFQPASRFKEIGAARLQEAYPFFYVYPFNILSGTT